MKKYENHKIENYNTHPDYLKKYYKNVQRNLEHSPEALKNFWFEFQCFPVMNIL